MSTQNKQCSGRAGKPCSRIMPYWDNHEVCQSCRNNSCSPSQTCEVCSLWDEELWRKFHKCLQRSDRLKKRNVPLSQVPENGPGLENTQHTVLPNVSVTVSATDIGQHERNRNHESDSDSVTQAPGINVSNVNITRQVPFRSMTPMDVAFERKDLFLDSFCLLGQIFSRRVDHLGQTLLPGELDILGALPLLIQSPVWSLFCLGILPDVNIHTRLNLGLNLLGHDISRGLLGPDIGQGHLDILNATDLDLGLLDLDILELCPLRTPLLTLLLLYYLS